MMILMIILGLQLIAALCAKQPKARFFC
jgi:hypothetical protein